MKFWIQRRAGTAATETPCAAFRPLRIAARAMCCAVGHNARAATAAINARLNHFRETGFVAPGGSPLSGGALYELDAWGTERLTWMLRAVLDEASADAGAVPAGDIAIVLTVAEGERPGWHSATLGDALGQVLDEERGRGRAFHAHSQFLALGKGGIARALERCSALLDGEGAPGHVMLVAADSLLNAGTIEHYLAQERLLTDTNADGFIPAEGAAALLLSRAPAAHAGTWIEAVATAQEDWRLEADVPMRAQGLTQAIRTAAAGAGCQVADLDFHASGMTGEAWYAKETSLALSRCIERRMPDFPHLMIARSVGETGAASPALTLAWLAGVMDRPEGSPGRAGLLHFAGDDGQRAALVVRTHS